MNPNDDYKTESRRRWSTTADVPSLDQLKFGCLQRIADATELMAKNQEQLQRDHDYYKRMYSVRGADLETLKRRLAAARGQVTKLKNKLEKERAEANPVQGSPDPAV
jgi:predicted  nucleic acid-binding Zn-ribbon protein